MSQHSPTTDFTLPENQHPADETLPVCSDSKDGVTQCQRIGCTNAARKKFCSSVCRQAVYRQSPAYEKQPAHHRQRRLDRRNRWVRARMRDKHFSFDGRHSGDIRQVGRLGDFENRREIDVNTSTDCKTEGQK